MFTNSSPATLADVTPIARLTQETEVVVVGKDSPLRTMADLLAAWKADPAGIPWVAAPPPAARTTWPRC